MARPGKGYFRKKSEASINPGVQRQNQNCAGRKRTGEPVQEALQTADLVRKGFPLLERSSVYPIVEESLTPRWIPKFHREGTIGLT